nr:DbpA RNA binding domain-containing protein [Nonlabens ulvanivorans]
MKTYFINLGLKDDINKGALLGYVCDTTGISGAQIGRIVMDKTHSYMDVAEDVASQILTLDGKQRNGHDLRVNEHKGVVKEPARERGGRGGRSGGGFKGRRDSNGGGGYKGRSNSGGSSIEEDVLILIIAVQVIEVVVVEVILLLAVMIVVVTVAALKVVSGNHIINIKKPV